VANVALGKDVIKGCLKAVALFADLSADELEGLASAARSVRFSKGARIFEEDTPADCFYVLTAGKARVVLSGETGSEILLHVVTPPGVVGEMALLDRSQRSASLVATDDCHLLRIPAAALAALRANPAFEHRLVARLAATVRESNDHVRVITTLPCMNRVAWCLARIARDAGQRQGSVILIPNTSPRRTGGNGCVHARNSQPRIDDDETEEISDLGSPDDAAGRRRDATSAHYGVERAGR
jgi:CRP-like cAMP-binding protein